jgi:hypothetical protein
LPLPLAAMFVEVGMQAVAAELHRCPPCRAAPAASLPRCAAAASRGEKSLRFALCPGGHPAWRCKDALLTWHSADVAHGAGRQTAAEAAEVAVLRAERDSCGAAAAAAAALPTKHGPLIRWRLAHDASLM